MEASPEECAEAGKGYFYCEFRSAHSCDRSLWRERGYVPEIDAIGNVYTRRGKNDKEPVLMLLAHTDTVFPPSTPITVERDGDILRGPGIGDNSVSVAAMISALDVLDALGE